jgi:hypothetical protein
MLRTQLINGWHANPDVNLRPFHDSIRRNPSQICSKPCPKP